MIYPPLVIRAGNNSTRPFCAGPRSDPILRKSLNRIPRDWSAGEGCGYGTGNRTDPVREWVLSVVGLETHAGQ